MMSTNKPTNELLLQSLEKTNEEILNALERLGENVDLLRTLDEIKPAQQVSEAS